MSSDEKRRHPRRATYAATLLICGDDGYLTEVLDISEGGARVARPKLWQEPANGHCRVFFVFDQDTVLGVAARMVRSGTEDIGLQFLPDQEARIESLLQESRFVEADLL